MSRAIRYALAIALVSVAIAACRTDKGSDCGQASAEAAPEIAASEIASRGEAMSMEEHPDYKSIRTFKNAHALELMGKYGAHSIGIRWKTEEGQRVRRPALAFYLDPNRDHDATEPVPPFFEFQPSPGEAVIRIPTEVIDSPQAAFESDPD